LAANVMLAATHRRDWKRRDMAWSLNQDGVLTQFDEKTKLVKQIDYLCGRRVRFSRERFPDEAAAAIAFGRQKVALDTWPPLIRPKSD
jgi:hypothetical protein